MKYTILFDRKKSLLKFVQLF